MGTNGSSLHKQLMEIKITSPEDLPAAARKFIAATGGSTVFAFYGPMGVGKTTFIKALCQVYGVGDMVNSPTFSIVNEYHSDAIGHVIYHFDFYRLRHPEEACDMGCEEYFYSGRLCFVEWPQIVEPLLPDDTVSVTVTEAPDGSRTLRF